MRTLIFLLTSILIFTSCNLFTSGEKLFNKNLLGFKTQFLSELGDIKYEKLEKELNKNKIEIKYLNDIIYISYLDELNACGNYEGDIETIGDTIKLKVELVSDEVCTSTSIERITFLINNPTGKKRFIKK